MEVAGELERRRRRLLDLIVTDPPVSREAVADLARAAGWALPRRVAVVALQDRGQDHFGPLPALPPDVLIDVARQDPACWCRTRRSRPGRGDRARPARVDRGPGPRGAARPGGQLAALGPADAGAGPAGSRRGRPRPGPVRRTSGHADAVRGRGTGPGTQRRPARAARPAAARPSRTWWRRPCWPGCRTPVTPGWPRASCMSTRRRSATGCARSRSYSVRCWPSPGPGSSWRWRCGLARCWVAHRRSPACREPAHRVCLFASPRTRV